MMDILYFFKDDDLLLRTVDDNIQLYNIIDDEYILDLYFKNKEELKSNNKLLKSNKIITFSIIGENLVKLTITFDSFLEEDTVFINNLKRYIPQNVKKFKDRKEFKLEINTFLEGDFDTLDNIANPNKIRLRKLSKI